MTAYRKAIVAALIAVLYAGLLAYQGAAGDGLQPLDALPVLAAVLGAVLTYLVPNVPQLPWAKTAVNSALGVLAALSQVFADGTNGVSVTAVLVSVIGALLVYEVPNAAVDIPGEHALDRAA